jgi:hypothetical protein
MLRERAVHLIRAARSSACLPGSPSGIRSLLLVTLCLSKVCLSVPRLRRILLLAPQRPPLTLMRVRGSYRHQQNRPVTPRVQVVFVSLTRHTLLDSVGISFGRRA